MRMSGWFGSSARESLVSASPAGRGIVKFLAIHGRGAAVHVASRDRFGGTLVNEAAIGWWPFDDTSARVCLARGVHSHHGGRKGHADTAAGALVHVHIDLNATARKHTTRLVPV